MVSAPALRIGLIAYTRLQLRTLRTLLEESGHCVGNCLLTSDLEAPRDQTLDPALVTDAWIVVVDTDAGDASSGSPVSDQDAEPQLQDWFDGDHWLDQRNAAVIFCDGDVPPVHDKNYSAWSRRLKEKLNQLTGAINLAHAEQGSAQQVWVLAASTGGPAAVKQFLAELPPKLDVGFIYVQHIDTGFKDTLAQVISRGSHYPAHVIEHGGVVRANEVGIVSPDHATELLANGTFIVNQRPWSAAYRPSADYIVASVAHGYGARSGVIVFTGMGDDAAAGSRMMRQKGGKVWVQTPGSCTSDSMPIATLATGCVDFKGNPFALAQRFVSEMRSARQQQTPELLS